MLSGLLEDEIVSQRRNSTDEAKVSQSKSGRKYTKRKKRTQSCFLSCVFRSFHIDTHIQFSLDRYVENNVEKSVLVSSDRHYGESLLLLFPLNCCSVYSVRDH